MPPADAHPKSSASSDPISATKFPEYPIKVTLAPLSSPHRSRAIGALCAELNLLGTRFPGSSLRLRYAVRETI